MDGPFMVVSAADIMNKDCSSRSVSVGMLFVGLVLEDPSINAHWRQCALCSGQCLWFGQAPSVFEHVKARTLVWKNKQSQISTQC